MLQNENILTYLVVGIGLLIILYFVLFSFFYISRNIVGKHTGHNLGVEKNLPKNEIKSKAVK